MSEPKEAALSKETAEQLTVMVITAAQQQQQLNAAMDRNMVANVGAVLTLGVQQANMAMLNKLSSIGPMEAAAQSSLVASTTPHHVAGLNTASKLPS